MYNQTSQPATEVNVLLVEDNPLDVELVRELFAVGSVPCRMHVVHTGQDALEFLRHEGKFQSSPRPDIMLLDLNLPDIDGLDVLSAIRGDRHLLDTIVIVLTSADEPEKLCAARGLKASMYLRKHEELDNLSEKLAEFNGFRVNIVQRPQKQ